MLIVRGFLCEFYFHNICTVQFDTIVHVVKTEVKRFRKDIWIRNDWSQKRHLLGGGDYFHPSPESDDVRVVQRL